MRPQQLVASPTRLVIDGETYPLEGDDKTPAHEKVPVATQPGPDDEEFERRLVNLGSPWGAARYLESGTYYYGYPGTFWRRMSWLPGMAYTNLSSAMGDRTNFIEWWDGAQSTRRLLVVDKTSVREIDTSGNLSINSLGVSLGLTTANGMSRGVRYRPSVAVGGGAIAGRTYISRESGTFVTRTAANTYILSASGKQARAFGTGKDAAGSDVLWRINENGRLNQCVASADPEVAGSWAGADYSVGETTSTVNDIWQQSKRLLVGREDGVFTYDANSNAGVPLTRGMEQLPDLNNFAHFKDFNGAAIAPSVMGLVLLDGLEWSIVGPVSSTSDARDYRGVEVAVSNLVGEHIYCAVLFSGQSYIFHGRAGAGNRPIDWHGIVAIVPFPVTDLHISTTYGYRLWVGHTSGYGYCILNSDLSPSPDAASGFIYLPEGILDMEGPGVIKDFRKAEFIAPAGRPFSATNSWTLALDVDGSGTYVDIDGGAVASGQVTSRWWATETSAKRARARLAYSGNVGLAELEQVIIRGTMRPEKTWRHTFRVKLVDEGQNAAHVRVNATARGMVEKLEALLNAGRKVAVVYGDEQFTARVTDIREAMPANSERQPPIRNVELELREVLLA